MEILLSNMGSYVNLGDRAILLGMVRFFFRNFRKNEQIKLLIEGNFGALREANSFDANLLSGVPFIHITSHPFTRYIKRIRGYSQHRSKKNQSFHDSVSYEHGDIMHLFTVLDLFLLQVLRIKPPRSAVEIIQKSHVIIMGGGTQIESVESSGFIPRFTHNLVTITLAKSANKPTFIFGQSIGPIDNAIGRFLARNILKKLNGIYLRENESKKYLKQVLKLRNANIHKAGDCAFLLYKDSIIDSYISNNDWEEKSIGICMRNIRQLSRRYLIVEFKGFVEYLCRTTGYHIYLYPQVVDSTNPFHNDLSLCQELYDVLDGSCKTNVSVVDSRHWSVFEAIHFLNKVTLLISMRMHPLIFRLLGKKKSNNFIAISHIHKFEGLMEDLDSEDCLLTFKELSCKKLIEKFEYVVKKDRSYEEQVGKIVQDLNNSLMEIMKVVDLENIVYK